VTAEVSGAEDATSSGGLLEASAQEAPAQDKLTL